MDNISYEKQVVDDLLSCQPHEVAVLCDFDGTISVHDVQVSILNKFARPDWRDAERDVLRNGHKSRRYLPVIYEGCKASHEEVADFIDETARIDSSFPEFVTHCRKKGWHIEIVSDGLSIYIERLLAKNALDVPYHSNCIKFSPDGVQLEFPNYSADCGLCGSCKRSRVQAARDSGKRFVIYAGDGISDECVADKVDILFAKESLESYCQKEALLYIPFKGFSDIIRVLSPALMETYSKR